MHTTREKIILGFQTGAPDSGADRLTCWGRDLKLHRALSLVLHHDSPGGHMIAMAYVAHAQAYQVASAQLAVDAKIEQRRDSRSRCCICKRTRMAQISLSLNGAF